MTEQEAIDKLNLLSAEHHEPADAIEVLLEFLAESGHIDIVVAWNRACERCQH